jgi:hypothetical protein
MYQVYLNGTQGFSHILRIKKFKKETKNNETELHLCMVVKLAIHSQNNLNGLSKKYLTIFFSLGNNGERAG